MAMVKYLIHGVYDNRKSMAIQCYCFGGPRSEYHLSQFAHNKWPMVPKLGYMCICTKTDTVKQCKVIFFMKIDPRASPPHILNELHIVKF